MRFIFPVSFPPLGFLYLCILLVRFVVFGEIEVALVPQQWYIIKFRFSVVSFYSNKVFWSIWSCALIVTEIIHCSRHLFLQWWMHPYICRLLGKISFFKSRLVFCTSLRMSLSTAGFTNEVLHLYNLIRPAIVSGLTSLGRTWYHNIWEYWRTPMGD